jgi:hypothetical protein
LLQMLFLFQVHFVWTFPPHSTIVEWIPSVHSKSFLWTFKENDQHQFICKSRCKQSKAIQWIEWVSLAILSWTPTKFMTNS